MSLVSRAAAPLWLLLLGAGQVATLGLINAGNRVGYQHYIPLRVMVEAAPPGALAVFAAQVVLAAIGCWINRRRLAALLPRLSLPALLGLAAVFVLTSATLSRNVGDLAGELVLATLVQLVHLVTALLFAAALPEGTLVREAGALTAADSQAEPGGLDRVAIAGAVWVTVLAALLGYFSYEWHPHVPDEVVYLRHAQYFARGWLWMPAPPAPEAFNVDLFTYDADKYFSPVPVCWPLVAAVGAFYGNVWLVNPVLGGINVLLSSLFLREIYPRPTARLIVLLLCISPWHVLMAMNLMTHTWTLTAALCGVLGTARLVRTGRLRWAVLGGAGIGMVALIRPLEGFAVALLLGLWSLKARGTLFRLAPSMALTLMTMAVSAITLPYNKALTGRATYFPIMAYTDRAYGPNSNALGFGPDRGLGWPGLDPFPGHNLLDAVINANMNLFQINIELLGWAAGAMLFVALPLALGRLRRADWMMIAAMVVVAGIHTFYWFSGGPDFGARYWYLVLIPCLALVARGIEEAGRAAPAGPPRLLAAAGALSLVTLLAFYPWRAVDKYHHYRGMRPDIRTLARDRNFGSDIVLIRGRRHPDYASAATYNPLDLRERTTLYAWDRSAEARVQLRRAYPNRRFWIVNGPSVTGDGFRIVAGPLSGPQLDSLPGPP